MKKHVKSLREHLPHWPVWAICARSAPRSTRNSRSARSIRWSVENRDPAPLFTNIRGYEPGFRVLGAPGALSSLPEARYARVAMALGLDPATHPLEIVEELATAKQLIPIPPVIVDSGPCQQNVLPGTEADLKKFPVHSFMTGTEAATSIPGAQFGGPHPRRDVDELVDRSGDDAGRADHGRHDTPTAGCRKNLSDVAGLR